MTAGSSTRAALGILVAVAVLITSPAGAHVPTKRGLVREALKHELRHRDEAEVLADVRQIVRGALEEWREAVEEAQPDPAPVVVSAGGAPLCDWECVQCESGGNPQAVNPTGTYWGLYQYDRTSWAADGGNPDTWGSAPAAEQHAVAARATFDRWPNC